MQNWQHQSQAPVYGQPIAPSPTSFPSIPQYGGPAGYSIPPYMHYPSESRFEYASFWRRFVAFWIDWLVCAAILAAGYIVQTSVAFLQTGDSNKVGLANLFGIVIYTMPLLYHVVMTTRGGSLGYRAMSLTISNELGASPTVCNAVLRQYPYAIAVGVQLVALFGMVLFESWQDSNAIGIGIAMLGLFVVPPLIWLTGCFVSIFDSHKQALHDKIAGTYVIHQRY